MKKAYFSADLFRFLDELRRNNRREWFEANRIATLRKIRDFVEPKTVTKYKDHRAGLLPGGAESIAG